MERLYREAPLNGIWEGTGNVICLDVLRSMRRELETVEVFLGEISKARGSGKLDSFADGLSRRLRNPSDLEPIARRVVEMMAHALQASLLLRHSSSAVADAFCAARLDGDQALLPHAGWKETIRTEQLNKPCPDSSPAIGL